MAVNADGLRRLAKSLNISNAELAKLSEACAKELGARVLRGVVKKTPTGIYPSGSGKVGGNLKRRWQVSTPSYRSRKSEVVVSNPVEYASYVEYGHTQEPGRYVPVLGKRLVVSWVPGKHMLTDTVNELRPKAQGIVDRKVKRYLERRMNGK